MSLTLPQSRRWIVRGGVVADAARGVLEPDRMLVDNGEIAAPEDAATSDERGQGCSIDARGLWLWPGLVDAHVHFREPGYTHKETVATGRQGAAAGGYAAVVCEPNTRPPLDGATPIKSLSEEVQRQSGPQVYFKGAMTKGRAGGEVADLREMARLSSVVAFSDDGSPVSRLAVMEDVCREAAALGLPLSPHCEDSPDALRDYAEGADPGFEPGSPYMNETNYVARELQLAEKWGCRIHFSHISLPSSLRKIERFRKTHGDGSVTFEVTPHHLLLCVDDYPGDSVPRVNPPLRSQSDRDALQKALCEGVVDVIASDHAPHSAREKAEGASGFIGLETTLPLIITHFIKKGRLDMLEAAKMLSTNPRRALGIPPGGLSMGQPADITFIDPNAEFVVRGADMASLSANTPFEGWLLQGRACATMVGGRLVWMTESFKERIHKPENQELA